MTKKEKRNIEFRMRSVRSAQAFLKECECTNIEVKKTIAGVAGCFTAPTGERWFIGAVQKPCFLKYYIRRDGDDHVIWPVDADCIGREILYKKI